MFVYKSQGLDVYVCVVLIFFLDGYPDKRTRRYISFYYTLLTTSCHASTIGLTSTTIIEERFEDGQSGWIVLESITVNRRLGGLLFSRCTLPPIDGRGNASPGTKRVIAGSPVLHLFHDRRELSTTRDAVWRAFMWNSPMYLPCVNIYMYVRVRGGFFFFSKLFSETCHRKL